MNARRTALLLACALVSQPVGAVDVVEAAQAVVAGTNAFRSDEGLEPLAADAALASAARGFADYMARTGRYGHTADGRRPVQRVAAEGYEYCIVAENIAYQYRSDGFPSAGALAQAFVEGWKESPGHRENMLDPAVRETGVGLAQGEGGRYFAVQLFARPKRAAISFEVRNRSGDRIEYQVGEERFVLAPHALRAHLRCRPAVLEIVHPAREAPFTTQAAGGTTYTVLEDGVVRR